MRVVKIGLVVAALFCAIGLLAQTKSQRITLTGRLNRAMAIGAETTGWTVDLDAPTTIGGRELHSVEISYAHPERLNKLVNQRVRVRGSIGYRQGVETGERMILNVSSIKATSSP